MASVASEDSAVSRCAGGYSVESRFCTSRTKIVIHLSSSTGVMTSNGGTVLPVVLLRCVHHSFQTFVQYCVSLCVFFGMACCLL